MDSQCIRRETSTDQIDLRCSQEMTYQQRRAQGDPNAEMHTVKSYFTIILK